MAEQPRVRNAIVLLKDGSVARAHGDGRWTLYPPTPQPPMNGAYDPGYVVGWHSLPPIGIVDIVLPVTPEEAHRG